MKLNLVVGKSYTFAVFLHRAMVKTNNKVELPLIHIINNYHININNQYPILLSDIILWLVTNTLPLPITHSLITYVFLFKAIFQFLKLHFSNRLLKNPFELQFKNTNMKWIKEQIWQSARVVKKSAKDKCQMSLHLFKSNSSILNVALEIQTVL